MATIREHMERMKEVMKVILVTYLYIPDNKKEKNTGCCITISHISSEEKYSSFVGGIDDAEKEIFQFQANEKITRLKRNLPIGHVSSWQSMNPPQNFYGGAIKAGDYIISVAGLHQMGDEAVALAVGIELGFIGRAEASDIAVISNNMLFESLMSAIDNTK